MAYPSSNETRNGFTTFAGVLALIAGLYNLLSGIAAVAQDDLTEAVGEVLYGIDISVWGWFWIVVGVAQTLAAVLVFMRNPVGQVLGVVIASTSAMCTVFLIFVVPLWALTVLAVDLFIIYALVVTEDFE